MFQELARATYKIAGFDVGRLADVASRMKDILHGTPDPKPVEYPGITVQRKELGELTALARSCVALAEAT